MLKTRWVLKQWKDETIQPLAATPDISCRMFIDLTRQSCAASLHWNHSILSLAMAPGSNRARAPLPLLLSPHPGTGAVGLQGCLGAYPSLFRDSGAEMKHAGPELQSSLLYLVPNPLCQQDFSKIIMNFQLWKHLGLSPEQCSGFGGFHSPAVILAEIDFLNLFSKYESF